MRVELIAHTTIYAEALSRYGFEYERGVSGIDTLAEFAGRSCYQSFDRPNPATATNRGYMAHIIDVGHFSVLEHGSATFYITGVSRSLTHELVRHRHFSYSQVSQRYVDEEHGLTVNPPAYRDSPDLSVKVAEAHEQAKAVYAELVDAGQERGLKRKEARQAARAVLPNATETRIVVTGNLRAWRDFLAKRHHEAADEEIQELAALILRRLRLVAENSVQDVPSEPYGPPVPALTRAQAAERLYDADGISDSGGILDLLFPDEA